MSRSELFAGDVITVAGLRANGNHGVFEHERVDGQVFVIDVTIAVDIAAAAAGDDLDKTVHYGLLSEQVVEAVERDPVDLIETVAERVASVALGFAAALAVRVTVHKPDAPITVPFADVAVTIVRVRDAGHTSDGTAAATPSSSKHPVMKTQVAGSDR